MTDQTSAIPAGDYEPSEQRVSNLELFFDLVVAFAITQVTSYLWHNQSWAGLGRAALLLGAIWWAWSAYAWLTNALDPEEGAVRMAVLAAVGAMLLVALTTQRAFGAGGAVFAVAYLTVRILHLVLFIIAGRHDKDLLRAVFRSFSISGLAPILLLIAAFVGDPLRTVLWVGALAVLLLGPLRGGMQGWRISPDHFVERFGLIVLIALGESIVAIGVGAVRVPLTAGVIAAALLGMTVAACLWWSYFDWFVYAARARLAQATGAERAVLARDGFSYLHLPMVGGIVLFAFGLKVTLTHVGSHLSAIPAVSLVGGVALYLLAHVALRLRISGGWGRGRPVAAVLLLVLLPLARWMPALATLAFVAVVSVGLIVYEFLRHREARAVIRRRRTSFSMEEAGGLEAK